MDAGEVFVCPTLFAMSLVIMPSCGFEEENIWPSGISRHHGRQSVNA